MNLKQYHSAYFIGIGGIGMSALARWFRLQGVLVSGYDRTRSALTDALEREGMQIHFDDSVDSIPTAVRASKEGVLVVYTPAIPANHVGKAWLIEQGYDLHKRSAVLGAVTRSHPTIAVAGTHGKTSTSGMITHILNQAHVNVVGLLGGILQGYNTNFIHSHGKISEAIMVVEADEFDRSFLQLKPDFACITSMDADHLDIYQEPSALQEAYLSFAGQITAGGDLAVQVNIADKVKQALKGRDIRISTYGLEEGDFAAQNIRIEQGAFVFDARLPRTKVRNIRMGMPGYHNIENAMGAMAILSSYGMEPELIKQGIQTYRGVKRRFELVYTGHEVVFIDDYAHHPTEIAALIRSVRSLQKGKKITAIFQPHLFTRTRDFAEGFSASLNMADEVILLPIYPAREEAIPGVSSDMLLLGIDAGKATLLSKDDLLAHLDQARIEVLLTIGAGDIDRLVEPIAKLLISRTYAD
jgi:UDP-N-acetylmuramate--alanine ligase